jgi:hypothetical protein
MSTVFKKVAADFFFALTYYYITGVCPDDLNTKCKKSILLK